MGANLKLSTCWLQGNCFLHPLLLDPLILDWLFTGDDVRTLNGHEEKLADAYGDKHGHSEQQSEDMTIQDDSSPLTRDETEDDFSSRAGTNLQGVKAQVLLPGLGDHKVKVCKVL